MTSWIERLTFLAPIRELLSLRARLKEATEAWRDFKVAFETVQSLGVPQTDIERENKRRFEDFVNQEARRIERALRGEP